MSYCVNLLHFDKDQCIACMVGGGYSLIVKLPKRLMYEMLWKS